MLIIIICLIAAFLFGMKFGVQLFATDLYDQSRFSYEEYSYAKSWLYIRDLLKDLISHI